MMGCDAVATVMGQWGKHFVCTLAGTVATLCCDGYESRRGVERGQQGTTCQTAVKEAVDAELELKDKM